MVKRNKFTCAICAILAALLFVFGFSWKIAPNAASGDTYDGKHYAVTGYGYIHNQVPQTLTDEEVTIQFDLFSFSAGTGFGWIGFAASDERYDWHAGSVQYLYAYGTNNFLAYYNGVGTSALTNGGAAAIPATDIQPSVNVATAFQSGQTVKAVFDPAENTFTLMTKTIKGNHFKTLQTIAVSTLPTANATFALQFAGSCDLEVANFKMTCGGNEIAYAVSSHASSPITVSDVTLSDDETVYENYAGIVNASGEDAAYGYLGGALATSDCIMEFDLLDVKNNGAIAFFAGANGKGCDLSSSAEYFCKFNADGTVEGGNGFEYGEERYALTGGVSLRAIFDLSNGKFVLQSKSVLDNSLSYQTVLSIPVNEERGNGGYCGVQVVSAAESNAYVVIDNFFLSDGDFETTYYNDFNDQTACGLTYRSEFGGVVYDESDDALYYADPCYDVVFMDYDGTVLSRQRVNRFNYAQFDYEGELAGSDFVGWSADVSCVTKNLTVLPTFSPKKAVCTVVLDGSKAGVLSKTEYAFGETAELSAPVYADALFQGWFVGGELLSEEEAFAFSVEENVTVTAKYAKAARLICINTQTGAAVTTLVEVGSKVTVTAPDVADCAFKDFTTDLTGVETDGKTVSFVMPENEVEIRCNYTHSGADVQEYQQKDMRGAITLYTFIGVYVVCLAVLASSIIIRRKWK